MSSTSQKNILFLLDDQHRGDALSCVGHPVVQTPNLDRLAQKGTLFTNCYTPSAICAPARSSLITGTYPTQHQILQNPMLGRSCLPDSTDTYLKHLQTAGYKTVLAGKWHCGPEGTEASLGIDEVVRQKYIPRPPLYTGKGWMWYSREYLYGEAPKNNKGQLSHGESELALGIYKLNQLASQNQPWYLNLSLLGPHDPYYASRDKLDLYPLDSIQLPASWDCDFSTKPAYLKTSQVQNNMFRLSERQAREYIQHYYAYITTIDEYFGEMITRVEEQGLLENTVIVMASDHGDHAGDFRLMGKERNFYEGITKVPLIICDPDAPAQGVVRDDFVSLLDLSHTFCDIADAPKMESQLGTSLLDPTSTDARKVIFVQGCYQERYIDHSRMIRKANWKYCWYENDMDELYDLDQDPTEDKNLINEHQDSDLLTDLKATMASQMAQIQDPALMFFQEQTSQTLNT